MKAYLQDLVAQKDAELQQLRQQVSGPAGLQSQLRESQALGRSEDEASGQRMGSFVRERLQMSGR